MAKNTWDAMWQTGDTGSRPDADAVATNAYYLATDTGILSKSDGVSTWTSIYDFASPGSGGGVFGGWYNVEDFGAVHDAASTTDADIAAATDDTDAINDALSACVLGGGGTVYFPRGIYAIKGALLNTTTYNSQLVIPQHAYPGDDTPPIAVRLFGEGPTGQWNHGTSGDWLPGQTGAILRSDWNGSISGVPAIIAAGKYDATYPAASFNWIEVTFQDIEFRAHENPKLSGIQMAAVASASYINVTVSTETDSASMAAPSNTNAYGVHSPLKINVNPPGLALNLFIDGFYTGIAIEEVFQAVNLSVHHCIYGIEAHGPQNHGSSIDNVWFVGVKTCLRFTAGIFFLNIANWREESKGTGTFAQVYDVDDASDYGHGFISHHIQEYGVSSTGQEIIVNGGANLSFHYIHGKRWTFNDAIELPDRGSDPTTVAGAGQLYAKSGLLYWREDSAGTVHDLTAGGSSITELDDVPDVNAPSPSNGDVLTWDSTPGEWVAAAPSGGSNALDDLTDVAAPTPSDGDVLTFDSGSGDWINAAPTGGAGGGGRGEYASKYNPDHETPTTSPADAEEFNTSTGMAWTSAPGVIDDLSTYPGFYRFKGNTTERHLSKAWTPGATDITIACKFSASIGSTATGSFGLYVGDTTGNPANGVYNLFEMSSSSNATYSLYNENGAGTFALIASQTIEAAPIFRRGLYLRLTRVNAGPTWTAYASQDGITWNVIGTTGSKSLTIGAFGLRVDSDHDYAVDWIRVWSSVVARVGA